MPTITADELKEIKRNVQNKIKIAEQVIGILDLLIPQAEQNGPVDMLPSNLEWLKKQGK